MAFYSERLPKSPSALMLHLGVGVGLVGMMSIPSALGLGLGLAALIGLVLLLRGRALNAWARQDTLLVLALASLPLAYLASLVMHGGPLSEFDRPSRLLVALLAFLAFRHYGLQGRWIGWAAFLGLGLAAAVASVQVFHLDWPRAAGYTHPIPFGNAALWLGGIALAGTIILGLPTALGGLAAILALAVSLLSGSRGGWVGLPIFASILGLAHPRFVKRPLSMLAILITPLLLLGLLILLLPALQARVMEAWGEARSFFTHAHDVPRVIMGSFDTRLEMWRVGLMAFLEAPWFGLGGPGLEAFLAQGAATGTIHPGLLEHRHLHNELVTTAARMGLIGLGALLTFWIGTWLFFWRTFRKPQTSPEARFYATMGLVVLGGSIVFSLSDSMFGTYPGIHALVLLLAIAAGGMRHHELHHTLPSTPCPT